MVNPRQCDCLECLAKAAPGGEAVMTAQEQYSAGLRDGEAWARATGTTSADLHMVPVVKGTRDYKAGHRVGVAKVRNERSLAEQGTPTGRALTSR
jgi:hypothetical protein